jgi:hypothetical protein
VIQFRIFLCGLLTADLAAWFPLHEAGRYRLVVAGIGS